MDPREGWLFHCLLSLTAFRWRICYNYADNPLVVYQRVPSQYASAPQQQPPQGESSLFHGGTVAFMPSGAAGMMNEPMANAALQYGSHIAQSGGQLMQQNVRLKSHW